MVLKKYIKQQNYLIIILQNVLQLLWSIDDTDHKLIDISPSSNGNKDQFQCDFYIPMPLFKIKKILSFTMEFSSKLCFLFKT